MVIKFSEVDIDAIIEESAGSTDDKLANQISSLTRMTDKEIKTLFPKESDAKKLVELMRIVKSAESQNNKANRLVENSEKFAGIVVTLLGKFI
jgi:hypothetical protein